MGKDSFLGLILAEFQPKPIQLDFIRKFAELSAQKWSKLACGHAELQLNKLKIDQYGRVVRQFFGRNPTVLVTAKIPTEYELLCTLKHMVKIQVT
jgi:hypothetical protein